MRTLPVLALVLAACGSSAAEQTPTPTPRPPAPTPPAPTPDPAPTDAVVFSYVASDGEFGYALELRGDGRWTRQEHSGSAVPGGTLPPDAVRRFRALVDAAPFQTDRAPCDLTATGSATFSDGTGRSAHQATAEAPGRGWIPCGDRVDGATEGLIGCLELLVDGSDAACATP